ncbi:hypothetical protein [Thermogutta sp.]|uniref:hypothetical protein n=1 Tax=Thermogutta sp. TaxID=1962930 RepID=UPI00321F9EBE
MKATVREESHRIKIKRATGIRPLWFFLGLIFVIAGEVLNESAWAEEPAIAWRIERDDWELAGAEVMAEPDGRVTLFCDRPDTVAVAGCFVPPRELVRIRASVRCEDVRPLRQAGYAYAAVYQYDEWGQLLGFTDFAQVSGTQDWKIFTWEGQTDRRAFRMEIRLGLHQAQGRCWFRDVVVEPAAFWGTPRGEALPGESVAVIVEPATPRFTSHVDVRAVANALEQAGYRTEFMTWEELAPGWCPGTYKGVSLLVFPDSRYYLPEARATLLRFLAEGADLLTFGGYAFDIPVRRSKSGWVAQTPGQPASVTPLLADSSFEESLESPDKSPWRRSSPENCRWVAGETHSGQGAAQISLTKQGSAVVSQIVNDVTPGQTLRLSGWIKTQNVTGSGYAFLAVYPFAGEKWIEPRDYANLRGTQDWRRVVALLTVPPSADRVEVRLGLYQAAGIAWFDDVQLEAVEYSPVVNTHFGRTEDGLEVSPWQLGLFDADAPLQDVVELRAGDWTWKTEKPLTGYSAVGVLRRQARWQPIVHAYDRWGRRCGTAGALMTHVAGPFRGSQWAFFGVEDVDLPAIPEFRQGVLVPLLKRMRTGVYLSQLAAELACFRPNEKPRVPFIVENSGKETFSGGFRIVVRQVGLPFSTEANREKDDGIVLDITGDIPRLAPGENFEAHFQSEPLSEGLYQLDVTVQTADGHVLDYGRTGFVIWDGRSVPGKIDFDYKENYFRLRGRPRFLCGTTTWSNWFLSPSQSDCLFWAENLQRMRDAAIDFVANLQTWWHDPYELSESEWRQLDAMLYLASKVGMIYRAGLFVGQDVAVDEATLERQARFARTFAERYKHLDGLIYYLNGDYQLHPKNDQQRSVAWQYSQTERWNARLVAAIREVDQRHPIISEYYQRPVGGLDLRRTLDGLDVAEVGYFGPPQVDLEEFAPTVKWIDSRLRGKSLAIGEFGVKTHPAWDQDRGAHGYHIRRSVAEQERLFLLLPQYVFALGGCAARNWCWRDDDDRVFPWGLLRSCDGTERSSLRFYRASSGLLSRLTPKWEKPAVLVISPDSVPPERAAAAREVVLLASRVLFTLGVDFAIAGDNALDEQTLNGVRLVIIPGEVSPTSQQILKKHSRSLAILWERELETAGRAGTQGDELVKQLRNRWRQVIERVQIARITITPDIRAIQAFRVPLVDGEAYVFVNAQDRDVAFTATLPYGHTVSMRLPGWHPGMVAVDQSATPITVEGAGRILWDDRMLVEADGHIILMPVTEGERLHEAKEWWLIPTGASEVRLPGELAGKSQAEVGRWVGGKWQGWADVTPQTNRDGVIIAIPPDLKAEWIRLRK